MKGLAITTIVMAGIFMMGMLYNLANGEGNGYTVVAMAMMVPILVFAIMFCAKYK